MTSLSQTVDKLIQLATAPTTKIHKLQRALYDVVKKAEGVTLQETETELRRMVTLVSQAQLFPAALVSIGCGALIEKGANPEIASAAILQRTQEALKSAPAFGLACQTEMHNRAGTKSDDDSEYIEVCVEKYGKSVAKKMPEKAQAWAAVEPLCSAALAVLMRLPLTRKAYSQDSAFTKVLEDFPAENSGIACLRDIFQVLDNEEIIVLHPALTKGYQIRISGVGDNFQLHILLADALIGDPDKGWIPGIRPDPLVAAAAKDGPFPMPEDKTKAAKKFPAATGAFNLWNWSGLKPDGTLPEGQTGTEHWIWNEGKPTDIALFEDIRIILLSPPPYERGWNAGRYFPGLKGELEVIEILSATQVKDWLSRIASAVQRN